MLYQTCARVHVDAVLANLAAVRNRVGPDRQILMAIKADGYGHGAVPIAMAVQETSAADFFGVATVPEGVELREAGVSLPILKLSPVFPEEARAAVAHRLTSTVCDAETVDVVERAAADLGVSAAVHLKVDTGMGRIGCLPEEATALARRIAEECPHLYLEGMFTHLPVSDTPGQDEFTAAQVMVFADCHRSVEEDLGRRVIAHAANSGGVLAHPDSWMDMVRPGVMLYGSYPDPEAPRTVPLRPALTWESRVSFVKEVLQGRTVGYGRTWTAEADTRVATVPVGYGDGYDRHLSNRGEVLVGGRRLPIVGRVCMDQLMVDVGADGEIAVGDRVVLLGRDGTEEISAADLAVSLDTIPYEVTCRIAARVGRIHETTGGE
ncbi:alanine racemase [Austwickia chelonae]|uniref:alanine racemase n=1 Tax=Austwickia chelonae TaxID=100225 RepID=UPI0013C2EDAC|nr:alanine racemase [Austwickia chelonae]